MKEKILEQIVETQNEIINYAYSFISYKSHARCNIVRMCKKVKKLQAKLAAETKLSEAVDRELSLQTGVEKEVSDADIEKWAKSFPGNTGNVVMDIAVTAGFIEGAKAHRDNLIKKG